MSRITELAAKLFNSQEEFRPKIIDTDKRVRGVLDGRYIFDTREAKLVWEGYSPHYWIPKTDFSDQASFKEDASISGIKSSTSKLTVGEKSIPTLLVPDSFNSELAGYVKIDFKDLDAWYEEFEQILFHPKDPFHRVDILPTGRHVKVGLAGKVLADTGKEGGVLALYETNLPTRWYLPPTAVNWEYLKPSQTQTGCPYKGTASYYNAVIDGKEYKDVVWYYKGPTYESGPIRDLLCFYPEKVELFVDGKPPRVVRQEVKKVVVEEKHNHIKSCNC